MKLSFVVMSVLGAGVLAAPVAEVSNANVAARDSTTVPKEGYRRAEGEALGFIIPKRKAVAGDSTTVPKEGYRRAEGEALGFIIPKREPATEAEVKRSDCGPNPHANC
ncbi:uncharacterized protein EKO05_0009894 [Ascochyta rabiei]|uniref:uncharacterized protein n=1 Tax=Didymella rabiei TaxID=5454 RepID=UPI0021FBF523|nr:uncharacterized protein EKO05_0009894 [Ascochyta rabiei]UPX19636.1 hypothetical protein EKO05_0009894 [Ascochyta rabiei]